MSYSSKIPKMVNLSRFEHVQIRLGAQYAREYRQSDLFCTSKSNLN